ncbi:superoxide dismutase [Mn/Fe]-like [Diadema antillarum]|uniref:superoxide dismutase [Mn/Fe]-like n=1 Tax=Diadema antillarum TaxID=105358 RepID=UPI003A88D84E
MASAPLPPNVPNVVFVIVVILSCFLSICQGIEDVYPYEYIVEVSTDYRLPNLPFDYGDLEPYIDEDTVIAHHQGHHAAYTRKLNAALAQWKNEDPDTYIATSILKHLENLDDVPIRYRQGIRNNGGGYVNHNLYWSTMAANRENVTNQPTGHLLDEINKSFGSFNDFQKEFTEKALTLFGSGYVWLSRRPGYESKDVDEDHDHDHSLVITMTTNQDTPISEGLLPILVLDVWEHAYYLKHQYRRAAYVSQWWRVVNWYAVEELADWWTGRKEGHDEL